jgi:hypothetical protein
VVDHQVRGEERIHLLRIAAQRAHGFAHGGEIDHRGHAGEVLQEHAGGHEGDFLLRRCFGVPARQRLNVFSLHKAAILLAQEILEEHEQRKGQFGNMPNSIFFQRVQAKNFVGFGVNRERVARAERILGCWGHTIKVPF